MRQFMEHSSNMPVGVNKPVVSSAKCAEDIDSSQLEGVLCKYTNAFKGWQYRWFFYNQSSGVLEYYEKEDQRAQLQKPRGAIPLAGAIVAPSDEDSQTFTVVTTSQTYRLRANDSKERHYWISQLKSIVQSCPKPRFGGSGLLHVGTDSEGDPGTPRLQHSQRRKPRKVPKDPSATYLLEESQRQLDNVSEVLGELQRDVAKTARKGNTKLFAAVLIIGILLAVTANFIYQLYVASRVNTPINLPNVVTKELKSEPSLLWGSYRPHLYFGLKSRLEAAPQFGIMWFRHNESPPAIRHWCYQEDRLHRYGWLAHDGVNFGVQEISDSDVVLMTSFVKDFSELPTGAWTAKIIANEPGDAGKSPGLFSIILYVAIEGEYRFKLRADPKDTTKLVGMDLITDQFYETTGSFSLEFSHEVSSDQIVLEYTTMYVERPEQLTDVVKSKLQVSRWPHGGEGQYLSLPRSQRGPRDNVLVYQLTCLLPLQVEVSQHLPNVPPKLVNEHFNTALQEQLEEFHQRFETTFQLEKKGFSLEDRIAAQAALSNMIGSIGYFYGKSVVQSTREPVLYWSAPLYSAVPSRSFFPRGFLWDEGFHTLLLYRWDPQIAIQSLAHWLDLMNVDGWIPREQILGSEAMARVPREFVVQRSDNANPPALFLTLQRLVVKAKTGNENARVFLHGAFPRLVAWYNWFNTTQFGPQPGTYQWRGRDSKTDRELNPKTLVSGLDDYPRASHPSVAEYHLDLRCWMALASRCLADIAKLVGKDGKEFAADADWLSDERELVRLHWSEEKRRFADFGLHTDSAKLQDVRVPVRLPDGRVTEKTERKRVVKEEPSLRLVTSAYGYVSLFPLLLQLLSPKSPQLGIVLSDLKNTRTGLWTDYGLRSLARSSPHYNRRNTEHDPPYWRGNIWVNMNYLAVRALHYYANTEGPHSKLAGNLYKELRGNLVRNILGQYKKTGYMWENYGDTDGSGHGSHPFTGWTSLVVLMMSEEYD